MPRTAKRSSPDIPVEVRFNFSREVMLSKVGGCRTSVKDKSRRLKLGHMDRKTFRVVSLRGIWRKFKVSSFNSRNSWPPEDSNDANNLEAVASVYTGQINEPHETTT